ncbi:DNA repair protein RadA [Candidatus Peregrinibacteria bacterium]|nr:DNA repair protein RadA [Candidatus Peregrinibacteria bacterium]
MKLKTVYICQSCSQEATKWLGQCPNCKSWNSFVEDVINVADKLSKTPHKISGKSPVSLTFANQEEKRIKTGILEFDRVVGGGITVGSLNLLSGEPGIGKSTLTLQIANNIAKNHSVLLISAEESIEQIGLRAKRLGLCEKNLQAVNDYHLESILETLKNTKPEFVIIDSIQVISSLDIPSAAGSITQVRYCTERLMEYAKTNSTTIILIGHVTKDGNLAGPRVLEHLVDTVMQLEGDRFHDFRLLRTFKNRFGSTNEIGIFEMNQEGLREVQNPSKQLLDGRKENAIGSAITVTIEGTRPLMVEVQALVAKSPFGYPKRTANGFDLNRLQLLIAVLEKYAKINLQDQDVFVNVVGGIKLTEPACDLPVLMAIASSKVKLSIPQNTIIFGEVGLSGELRKTSHVEKRQQEGKKLGFSNIANAEKFKEVSEVIKLLREPHYTSFSIPLKNLS